MHWRTTLAISLRFYAVAGETYALYGYLIGDTDIEGDGLQVFLAEETSQNEPVAPRSVLTLSQTSHGTPSDNHLFNVVPHHLVAPVSQYCTFAQLAEIAVDPRTTNALDDWAEAMLRNALRINDMIVPALDGLIVGHSTDNFPQRLERQGFSVRRYADDAQVGGPTTVFADFMVWPEGVPPARDSGSWWGLIETWFGRQKIGGIGIITCRYRPSGRPLASPSAAGKHHITQNEIGRSALNLIDEGFSVVPLAFSATDDLALDDAGLARFALIARRVGQLQRI